MLASGPLLCSLITALQMTTITAGGDVGLKTRVRGIDFAAEGWIRASAVSSSGRHPGNWYGYDETAADPSRQYNGRVYDPSTGFHDYGARLYWPEIGRFISVDSAGPNFADPMTLNRYAYVLNNPYKYVDPTGHFSVMPSIWGKEGGPLQWFAKWFCTEMAKQSLDERLPWTDRAQAAVAGTIVSLLDVEAVEKTGMVLGLAGSLRVVNERPTIDSRTGEGIGRFVADPNGNTMIEPVGGTTQAAGRGGVDTHTTYPNGSNYQRLNPQGHANNPTPHAHGHAKGTGPGMKGQGPSLSPDGRQVPANSSDAHWPVN